METAPGPSAGAARGRLAWIVGTPLAAAVLMFCYLRIAGTTQVNSDGAGLVWEASSILHGNVLLHGWWATDVSFYTTELPEYVTVTAFAGLRPEVVHICSALTYTLLVLLAAFVARGRARGAEGVIRALLAAGIMLAPQPTGPTQVLLGSPDHVGTAVPVLVLLLLLDWAPPRWYGPAGAGILLAASIVGDPLIEVVGVLPLFLGCLIRAGRILSAAAGGRGRRRRPRRAAVAPPRLGMADRLVRVVARRRGGAGRPGRPPGQLADRAPGRVPHRQGVLRPAASPRDPARRAARRAERARAVRRRLPERDRRGQRRLRAGAPHRRGRCHRRRAARRAAPDQAR